MNLIEELERRVVIKRQLIKITEDEIEAIKIKIKELKQSTPVDK